MKFVALLFLMLVSFKAQAIDLSFIEVKEIPLGRFKEPWLDGVHKRLEPALEKMPDDESRELLILIYFGKIAPQNLTFKPLVNMDQLCKQKFGAGFHYDAIDEDATEFGYTRPFAVCIRYRDDLYYRTRHQVRHVFFAIKEKLRTSLGGREY